MEWQSLNVGILAFSASFVAFNISRFHEAQRRKRELVAAKAFLPNSLSGISGYLADCANVLKIARSKVNNKDVYAISRPQVSDPILPSDYKEVFEKCIVLADAELGEYLAYVLMRMQIIHSRTEGMVRSLRGSGGTLILSSNISNNAVILGEIQSLVNNLFPYARGLEDFHRKNLDLEAFTTAYANLGFLPDELQEIVAETKRHLGKGKSSWKIA
jgi:hypothetical protein